MQVKLTRFMLLLIIVILLLQALFLNSMLPELPILSGGQDKGSDAALAALTQFLDAWVDGNAEMLLKMLVPADADEKKDETAFLHRTVGRYRLSEYRMEGEITNLSSAERKHRKTFSCLILISDNRRTYAFRILPQMVRSGREWGVDAQSIQQWTQISLYEYQSPGMAVNEAM